MHCMAVVLSIFALSGCASNTGTGVITGVVLGATAGGIGGGGTGALIGSAAGLIVGGLVGAALDERDRKVMQKSSPRTVERMDRGDCLTLNDIIKLSQSGVSDDAILEYMKATFSAYSLSQAQIRRLMDAGVSAKIVNMMVNSGKQKNID